MTSVTLLCFYRRIKFIKHLVFSIIYVFSGKIWLHMLLWKCKLKDSIFNEIPKEKIIVMETCESLTM